MGYSLRGRIFTGGGILRKPRTTERAFGISYSKPPFGDPMVEDGPQMARNNDGPEISVKDSVLLTQPL